MLKKVDHLKKYRQDIKSGKIVKMKQEPRPSMIRAIKAKCKECMCDYADGRIDCEINKCSHYYWMPYGQLARNRREMRNKNRVKI